MRITVHRGAENGTEKTLGMGATQFESVHCARSTPSRPDPVRILPESGRE